MCEARGKIKGIYANFDNKAQKHIKEYKRLDKPTDLEMNDTVKCERLVNQYRVTERCYRKRL